MDISRVGGALLVVGAAAFLVGAANPALFAVWTASLEPRLGLIAENATAWTITNALFLIATVLTAAGLWFVPDLVGSGGSAVARAASVAYLLAAAVWTVSLVVRLAVVPPAATAFETTHAIDPGFLAVDRLGGALFAAFTIISGGALIAIGIAVVIGGSLAALAGWFAVAIGLVVVIGFLVSGDMPPFVTYLPTGLLGLVILLTAR